MFIGAYLLLNILKVQKRTNRTVGDKKYVKWYVNIPSDEIEKLKWKESMDLEYDVKNQQITLKPKKTK